MLRRGGGGRFLYMYVSGEEGRRRKGVYREEGSGRSVLYV